MQAIFGYINWGNGQADQILHLMNQGFAEDLSADDFHTPNVALGVRRRAIHYKLQEGVCVADKSKMIRAIMVGEIHNAEEIRDWLLAKGHHVKSKYDTELIAHLYEEEGPDLLRRLDGLIAFAVWDERNNKLTIGLDRYGGIFRMFYVVDSSYFAFFTSVKPLLHIPGFNREVNEETLAQFFTTGHILPPASIFRGMSKLAPGCVAVYEKSNVNIRRVDWFEGTPQTQPAKPEDLVELLHKAMQRRLSTDQNLGVLLSGGLDSSTIIAIASKLSAQPLTTISAKIPYEQLDESVYAIIVAKCYSTRHYEMIPNMEQAIEPLPHIVWWLEEPLADASAVPMFHLLSFAKGIVQGVIAGDGPDHLFGRQYPMAIRRKYLRTVLDRVGLSATLQQLCKNGLSDNKLLSAIQRALRCSLFSLEQAYFDRLARPTWHTMGLMPISNIFGSKLRAIAPLDVDIKVPIASNYSGFDRLSIMDFYVDGSFGVFQKIGRMADANNLIVREPFLDRSVCDLICRLPQSQKVSGNFVQLMRTRGRIKKALFDTISTSVLPDEILTKPKGGFAPPTGVWLHRTIGDRSLNQILSQDLCDAEFFDLGFVQRIFTEHRTCQRNWGRLIYMLVVVDLWYRTFIATPKVDSLKVTLSELWNS